MQPVKHQCGRQHGKGNLWVIVFVLILFGLGGYLYFRYASGPAKGLRSKGLWNIAGWPESLTLIFTSENLGWLAPCGCGGSNLGGMKYRKTYIDEKHKGAKGPILLLDTGNFTDGTLAYHLSQSLTVAKIMGMIGYRYVNLGSEEVKLGAENIKKLQRQSGLKLVSSNVKIPGLHFAESQPLRFGKLRVRLFGFQGSLSLEEQYLEEVKITRKEVREAIKEQASRYSDEDSIKIALLCDFTKKEEDWLWEENPFDVVLGLEGDYTIDFPADIPATNGNYILLAPTGQGKTVDTATLTLSSGTPSKVVVERGYISMKYKEDKRIGKLVDEEQRKSLELAKVQEKTDLTTQDRYVGAYTCRKCHLSEFNQWVKTGHSEAVKTLQKEGAHQNVDCLSCHTTGFGRPTGYALSIRSYDLENVGCEICHGKGGFHLDLMTSVALGTTKEKPAALKIKKTPVREDCLKCHTKENSPHFDFEKYYPRITHKQPE